MGPVYERFLGFLPGWTLLTSLVAVAAWLALRQFQPRLEGPPVGWSNCWCHFLHAPLNLRRDWSWLTAGCGVLLLLTDYHGFTQGFFRWDDFAFIQDARGNMPLPELLRMYHSDHSMPLFRLWVSGVVDLMGPSASASQLAGAFNLVNYLTCLGVLLAGACLLAECSVRRISAICYCLFAWFWPGWGEFTTGFFTLIVYPQTFVCGALSITTLLRYLRGGAIGWMLAGLFCALLACGLDISGIWVFPAIGGFTWAVGGWRSRRVRLLASWLLLAFGLAAYYHLVWFHHPFEGREFVQNPRGQTVNHSLVSNLITHFWRIPLAVASGVGGTLLSTITPGFLGMTAPQFSGNTLRCAPVYATEALVLAGTAWVGWRNARRLVSTDRLLLLAFVLPVFIIIGMIGVARVHGLDLPGSLWPTKYFCLPQAWAVLAAVFLLDRTALSTPAAAQRTARWIAGAVIAGVWLVATFWYLERALAINAARIPAGRQGNTAVAERRRADFDTFQRDIEMLARRTGRNQIDVPPPLGFYWAHPFLEFGFGPVLGGTYLFTDLLSVAPVTGITLRECPRAEVPPQTLKAIEEIPALQRVFDPTPPSP